MSAFALKLIAILSMLTDHSAWFLTLRGLISPELYTLMRSVGRMAFPIFCFMLVNGFDKSSDRRRYLTRLVLFGVISEIPYSTLFSSANFRNIDSASALSLSFATPLPLLLTAALALGAIWFFLVRRDATAVLTPLALMLAMTDLSYRGAVLLNSEHVNVMCTLAIGLSAMCIIDGVRKKERAWYETALLAAVLLAVLLLCGNKVDYGYSGLAFLIMLYLTRQSRAMQIPVVLLWCAYTYLIYTYSIGYLLCAALSVIPMLLYSGKHGPAVKWLFYVFYPLHLSILAILIFV